jgi:hypothetical protein
VQMRDTMAATAPAAMLLPSCVSDSFDNSNFVSVCELRSSSMRLPEQRQTADASYAAILCIHVADMPAHSVSIPTAISRMHLLVRCAVDCGLQLSQF